MNGGTLVPGGLLCLALLLSPGCSADDTSSKSGPTSTKSTSASSAPSNRIVFNRGDVGSGQSLVYTMNPDGSDTTSLFPRTAYGPRWAPDRSEISIFCCDDGMSAHFVNLKTGALRTLNMPDPGLETFCGSAWSPDGKRLACESYGVDDPRRNGIYSIRVTDGGGLTRITSNPGGGDIAGDFSPDGRRLVFVRSKNEHPVGIFVINIDGSGLRAIAPKDMLLDESGFSGSWSPSGNNILFVAHASEGGPKRIWTVNADGGAPTELPIADTCQFGCYSPDWSPNGTKIAFVRSDGSSESIYLVNPDGSGLVQISDGDGDNPDWGTPRQGPCMRNGCASQGRTPVAHAVEPGRR